MTGFNSVPCVIASSVQLLKSINVISKKYNYQWFPLHSCLNSPTSRCVFHTTVLVFFWGFAHGNCDWKQETLPCMRIKMRSYYKNRTPPVWLYEYRFYLNCCDTKLNLWLCVFSHLPLTSLVNFWSDIRSVTDLQKGRSLHKRFPPCWLCLHQGPGHCRIISIWYAMSYWLSLLSERQFYGKPLCFWKVTHSGVKGDGEGALTGMRPRGFWRCSMFNHCGDCFAGKFREKASILHKIAKKKCQVEDSEKANGVASRSGG